MSIDLNEAETRAELIDPVLATAGWGKAEGSRVRREVIAPGRLIGSGKRGKQDIADYVLFFRGQKLAVIEAKKVSLPDTEGLGQAKRYATKLQTRFAYSTNGKGIYRVDMETGEEGYVTSYPSPEELWNVIFPETNNWRDRFSAVPFEDKGGSWEARYYQHNAIEKALDAIADGEDRILLTLATGTGKTAIAFQIAWKLFHSKWNLKDWKSNEEPKRRPRILFLADRNILADQAYNSFSAFSDGALARISPGEIRKKGSVPKNANIFFTIFQSFMSGKDGEDGSSPYYKDYPKDFFDFIVIDECHRGGANDESTWRDILEHFSPAVQLGLTATPKRDANADTYSYFGEPVYIYSLKEGINDGFLTPFKVEQITTTLDEYTYTSDDNLIEGEVEAGKVYTQSDFNRVIEIKEREAYRVKLFMQKINQKQKTLVFCATQDHALAVRDLINQLKVSADPNYCVRVTANDGEEGERWLRIFQDNEKTIPTVLTTSQKLSTGVDARNIRNIVIMRPINSLIEFKQIIGRGTRLFDNKDYFTVYDYVRAYEHFNDPEWDGEPAEPVAVTSTGNEGDNSSDGDLGDPEPPTTDTDDVPPRQKIKIKLADGKERAIHHISTTTFWGPEGKQMSAAEFIEQLFGEIPGLFKNEDELRTLWGNHETRKALLAGLEEKGYGEQELLEIRKLINAEKSDLFDVLAYIAYAKPTVTREERVMGRKEKIYNQYNSKQQEFLSFVLDHYIAQGVGELDQDKLPALIELKYHSVSDAVSELGNVEDIRNIFTGFQPSLYE